MKDHYVVLGGSDYEVLQNDDKDKLCCISRHPLKLTNICNLDYQTREDVPGL